MNETLVLGGRAVGPGRACLVIAEAGTGHNGDLGLAEKLVAAAARAGADCVKFQVVIASEIVHPLCGPVQLPGGAIPLYERFRSLERPVGFYHELKAMVEAAGLLFLATPFGAGSARLLQSLGVAAFKIASPELNHFPLLDLVAGFSKPMLLSTGVSTLEDISLALEHAGPQQALLHCVTSYPAREEEYNLRLLPRLAERFDCPVGVSDHSRDPLLVPGAALLEGAVLVEKHLCLSNDTDGLDDPVALTETGFVRLVDFIRETESRGPAWGRRELEHIYGAARLETCLGTGEKTLAAGERDNYRTTRRSILALTDIRPGQTFSPDNIGLLRSEKNLSPGLDPRYWHTLQGLSADRAIPAGKGLEPGDIIGFRYIDSF